MMKIKIFLTTILIGVALCGQAQNNNVGAKYNEAIRYIGDKDYSGAKSILDEVLKIKPDYAEALFARGTCYLMLDKRIESCEDFEKASKLNWKPAKEYIEKFCNTESLKRYLPEGTKK